MKKILSLSLVLCIALFALSSCGQKEIAVDYSSAESFETALNEGKDLTGKTVAFTVDEIAPDSAFGFNLFAGEHLNFCSEENPGVSVGDTVFAKVSEVQSVLGSYIIYYKLIKSEKGQNADDISVAETQQGDTTTDSETEPNEETIAETESEFVADYENAEDFEAALNEGKDLAGKTVTFVVENFIPDSAFGYNLTAGEHLNFCSSSHPGAEVGDTVTVKVTEVESMLGSFIIYYDKVA